MLSDREILEAINNGTIHIDPFEPKHLGPNSYDLRLGNNFFRQKAFTGRDPNAVVEFESPLNPTKVWDGPFEAPDGKITLAPGELILAHTHEFVATTKDIVGELASRSSMMRMGIAVCVDAGLGDVGYASYWTMEIYNHLKSTVVIPVGARVAQMKFHRVGLVQRDYQEKGGSYGMAKEIWKPEDMLPRSKLF